MKSNDERSQIEKWSDEIRLHFSKQPRVIFEESYYDQNYLYQLGGEFNFVGVFPEDNEINLILHQISHNAPDKLLEETDDLFAQYIGKQVMILVPDIKEVKLTIVLFDNPLDIIKNSTRIWDISIDELKKIEKDGRSNLRVKIKS